MDRVEENTAVADRARERVEEELTQLLDRLSNLVTFYYGEGLTKANLSKEMTRLLETQMSIMSSYVSILHERLKIWGKTDDEIESLVDTI